jgi:hypothetical protein
MGVNFSRDETFDADGIVIKFIAIICNYACHKDKLLPKTELGELG